MSATHRYHFRLALFTTALLCLTACSEPVQLNTLLPNATVLAFGDSLTYGTGAEADQSYPAQLAKLIQRKVINAGLPGELSADGAARLPSLLDQHQPSLLILCHGGNDFLRRKSLQATRGNIQRMISLAKSRHIDVVLMATPAPGLLLSAPDFYQELAEQHNIPFDEDIIAEVVSQNALKSDVVHPNGKGYRLIAERVAGLLKAHGAY